MANEIARALRRRLTQQEVRVWVHLKALRPQGYHFRRQVPIAGYIVDFAFLSAKLVVEIDGAQHGMPTGLRDDHARDDRLAELGFKVLRFWNVDVDRTLIAVIDTIVHESDTRLPRRPILPRDGKGGA